ncbi:MAG TPA: hypothetical protein VGM44_07255 [Polyangiaceae bacterium]|jgi:hypothetical protein
MHFDSRLQRHTTAVLTRHALLAALLAAGCAAPQQPAAPKKVVAPAASASTESPLPAEPPLPILASGTRPLVEVPGTFELSLLARTEDGAFEILEYRLPGEFPVGFGRNEVLISGTARPYAFFHTDPRAPVLGSTPLLLWVRRPLAEKGQELSGESFVPALYDEPGKHLHFHAVAATPKSDPKLTPIWAQALAEDLDQHRGPFYGFAADKLRQRAPKPKLVARNRYAEQQNANDLALLIGTTTGRSSVQEALEQRRALYLDLAGGARKVPIDKLIAPRLTRHPWATMLAQLKQKPTDEPLAKATPADFYFLRVRDFGSFLDLSAIADSWGTPALDVLDGQIQDRNLRERYQTELALEQGELTRTFGPSVIEQLALVGSDPYLVEGSDLTLIFRVKSSLLFEGALLKSLSTCAAAHPGGESQKFTHEGVDVTVARSADGRIRRHRATVDGFELVSNSPTAIRRVISAIHGKAPRLADEPDFSYMLARDADQSTPILAFAGDRFVANVIGPQQKIKEAERALALAEVSRPGYAALLYGFLNGHSPQSAHDLLHEGLLSAADLKPGGVAASWQPGAAAQSTHGSTISAQPLLDSPDVTQVTTAERDGYDSFARSYESEWSDYIDPFAVRVARTAAANGGTTLSAELRVLPLLRREYRDFTASVGNARVEPGAIPDGFRMLLGVGKDAELRHILTSATRNFTEHELSFDWLGDYAFLGVADRNELVLAARYQRDFSPEKPEGDQSKDAELRAAALTPAYAGIAIRSQAAAAIALALLKRVGDQVAPNSLTWSEARKHRGIAVMCIGANDRDVADFKLYYALTPHALLFSLNAAVLEALIDQSADAKEPTTLDAKPEARAPQLVIDLKGKRHGAISTVLAWLLTKALTEGSDRAIDAANAVFHGAPETQMNPAQAALLMRNYFGSVAKTPEGRAYEFGPSGVRDPLRGSASVPTWPLVPVADSPVAGVVDRLESLRSEVSFDPEPSTQPGNALQSLRVRLSIALR